VGVGISLASNECGTIADSELDAASEDATSEDGALNPPHNDASTDVVDAGSLADVETPTDAMILDAFCDSPFPTTKGSGQLPWVCAPTEACAEAGAPPTCWKQAAPSRCSTIRWGTYCVAGDWKCATGALPTADCKCWDYQPADACP